MFEMHEIELKAKFTVTVPNRLTYSEGFTHTTTVNTETTSPGIFRSLPRNLHVNKENNKQNNKQSSN